MPTYAHSVAYAASQCCISCLIVLHMLPHSVAYAASQCCICGLTVLHTPLRMALASTLYIGRPFEICLVHSIKLEGSRIAASRIFLWMLPRNIAPGSHFFLEGIC
jgi:hypothetical protein